MTDRTFRKPRWRRRLAMVWRGGIIRRFSELLVLLVMVGMIAATALVLQQTGGTLRPLSPAVVALLLVANLMPAMGLLVLVAQRMARGRSERTPLGRRGGLHARLVTLFSMLAAFPTLLVVIFASLLFQYGVQFWFSDRAKVVLTNADRVAQTYIAEHKASLQDDNVAMRGDLLNALALAQPDDPRWDTYFASQVYYRKLDQAAVIRVVPDGSEQLIWGANLDRRSLEQRLQRLLLPQLKDGKPHSRVMHFHLESVIQFDRATNTFLWIQRRADPEVLAQAGRANGALADYRSLTERARVLQFQFNAALFLVSLLIVALAIWVAFRVADRLVRPIGDLVGAARRVAGGDLAARVPAPNKHDEVGTLAAAFNRMTRRLQEQTGALESRRAFTEAVLSGVSAGVVSVDPERVVTLVNVSARALLRTTDIDPIGRPLEDVAPELDRLLDQSEPEAVVHIGVEGDPRTLAVTIVVTQNGHVLTFDDITQQLNDQRRAAWADVARRIAHEIKNPLTPIQLAAERLQRRYGQDIEDDSGTFGRLVSTIVRQVGDIRRMIDEFSSFARMPKPTFRTENLTEVARQVLFLHEVAHPGIRFTLVDPAGPQMVVCDRRQMGQALTNLVKNAVEAIEGRGEDAVAGAITLSIARERERLTIDVADDGVGLPPERDRLTEPYMTTRAKGTGLGLAIVRRIVEEHHGSMQFADRPGGGAIVHLDFDTAALERLAEDDPADEERVLVTAKLGRA
ncbi:ATP-binding protein [uncultured Sphingomonas sp.]|uniref:sensor histidine kinase NtrY-like n=1 Tax=uncultured Sphingomonas sp. TaxID=158754 RepID=UPI0025DFA90F|nr:ATP-binding protein [uncultured Sphingomonas sp.]